MYENGQIKIIYASCRNRNGGKYVHSTKDFCKKSSLQAIGGSHESRYMLRIFNKAGSCKDLYSKVYKTYGIKNSFPVPPPKPGKSALGTRFQIHLIWMPDSLDHRSVRNKEVRFI